LKEVVVFAGFEVLMEVDYIVLIAGNPQGILDQQLSGLYYKIFTIVNYASVWSVSYDCNFRL
jgi:hypothetical protein